MRLLSWTVSLLLIVVAFVPQVSAIQCREDPSNGSVVEDTRQHAQQQCNNVIRAVYGGDVVGDMLAVVDGTCFFLTGSTCLS